MIKKKVLIILLIISVIVTKKILFTSVTNYTDTIVARMLTNKFVLIESNEYEYGYVIGPYE